MQRILAALLAALCAGICAFGIARATTLGIVRGTVTLDGAPAAGADVTLAGEGSRFTTTTDSRGVYTFTVPFGYYLLTVHDDDAQDRVVSLNVSSDSIQSVDVALTHLKAIAHAVAYAESSVTGNPVAVNQMDRSQIQASPVENNIYNLVETMPGIVQFSYNEPVALGFHGVTYEVDGAPLPLATADNFSQIIDPNQIDSLEVYSGDFPAEYGGQRMGALTNIITDRAEDVPQGLDGQLTEGGGNFAEALGQLDLEGRTGDTEVFLDVDSQRTNYGLDAPTYVPIDDNSNFTDEFFRALTQINYRQTLTFDYGNEFSQYQIPINTQADDPLDPEVSVPGTDDQQREYDRFSSINYTLATKDGNGYFQIIPWYRLTQIVYAGDLADDVLATEPDPITGVVDHLIGLNQDRFATYAGLRLNDSRSVGTHTWKVGLDMWRENYSADETFACYYNECANTGTPVSPYYSASFAQAQAGSQLGAYAEDTWQPTPILAVQYGLRYDHSSGYVGGDMLEPRISVNLKGDSKNIIHVYYGRTYAAPQLEDVSAACAFLGASTGECISHPVYNLKPETDSIYEVGLEHTFSPTLTGYVNFTERNVINVLDTTQLLNTPLFAVFNNALGRYQGVQLRLQDRLPNGNYWFVSTTISGAYAGGISGATFLFGPEPNPPGVPLTSAELLSAEDHDQTVHSIGGYTYLFGATHDWFATLQGDYGTGFPVFFENATEDLTGRLPSHLTFDGSVAKTLAGTPNHGLGIRLDIQNMLNHQYIVKIANGFNTTQIAPGRGVLLRLTEAF